jgi:Zn-dependent peptidase ImmA (M78 family)
MTLPDTPKKWAIHISNIIQHVQKTSGENFYPIKVQEIACELSKTFCPDEPIVEVCGRDLPERFEGAIFKTEKGWVLLYNNKIRSQGRINFTLAHEFGHYLLHRADLGEGVQCSRQDMMRWDTEYGQRESQANQFASFLLIPRNLFEERLKSRPLNMHVFQEIAESFGVSLTAVLLKWIEFTSKRAMLVVAKDGFIDWAYSSGNLYKSGVFLRSKQETIELPPASLAARKDNLFDNETGTHHKAGIWPFKEDIQEMTVLADSYDMTISLLIFDDQAPSSWRVEEEEEIDTVDHFNGKRQSS